VLEMGIDSRTRDEQGRTAIDLIFDLQDERTMLREVRTTLHYVLKPFMELSRQERLDHERDIICILISSWRIKGF